MKTSGLICLHIFILIQCLPATAQTDSLSLAPNAGIYVSWEKPYPYVYRPGDTLWLAEPYPGTSTIYTSVVLTDSIQINGTGAKELIFLITATASIEKHGGSFDISEKIQYSKYEVWNPDTKTRLFEAVNDYDHRYSRFQMYATSSFQSGTEWYRYHFSIDKRGVISISKYKGYTETLAAAYPVTLSQAPRQKASGKQGPAPDKTEGRYVFKEDAYQKQQP